MRSEGEVREERKGRKGRILRFLRSPELGLLCGGATVLLLAVGSFVVAGTRDGASAALRTDELAPFFTDPSPWHLWLYLLVPVLGLYGLNTLLCTWDTTVERWRKGQHSPWQHGPAIVHAALLVALLAHLVGGFGSRDGDPVVVGRDWTALGDGRRVRLGDLRPEFHPGGQLAQLTASLDVAAEGQDVPESTVEVSFSHPLTSGWGSRLWLLAGVDDGPVVVLRPRDAPGVPWALAAAVLLGSGLVLMGRRWL
ncbi:MAG: hypothetical protein HY825_16870 [Acidobacteria bacterium]|nr:hypothetical protein [Acidobacteriota bacterium]